VRVAVLVSGTGTILRALLEARLPVVVVIADRPCGAMAVAEAAGVEAVLVDREGSGGFGPRFDRSGYTARVVEVLEDRDVGLVAMAGFGTVLAEGVHQAFEGRIVNTHPALLPAFPGWHAVRDALAAGVTVTGCTVHLATLAVDEGPVLAQEEVPVLPGDTEETLHERIKVVERRLYPAAVRALVARLDAAGTPARAGAADRHDGPGAV
jgi:phosphoribosylglycinamide formyltransferase 1